MASTANPRDFFNAMQTGGTNLSGDSEFNTIWWKMYTWDSMDTDDDNDIDANDTNKVCGVWYHLPSDAEWEILETTLNGGTNCRNATNGHLCDGLGWMNNGVSTRKMADTLKIPLAGYRYNSGTNFSSRGKFAELWSSTPGVSSDYYLRRLSFFLSTVERNVESQTGGRSVRCLKNP